MPNAGQSNINGSLRLTEGGVIFGDINGGVRVAEERFARVTLTSAEILALFTTPKTLVPAPGPGKIVEFLGMTLILDATATAYAGVDAGEDICVKYTNAAGAIVSTTLASTGFIDQTSDQIRTIKPITTDITPVVNAPLVLHLLVGNITTGTGVLYANVHYRIVETGL